MSRRNNRKLSKLSKTRMSSRNHWHIS
ncbi:hypothetical protein Bhyg_04280 [Pseudolycoriella hygida]|uniref:Uncharacterized protein n=1 Tax=Pseudolycoriella hygida TaxID=35572 RepID=A0A9Q0NFR5_9DIPT|nr:hypothetical protein Bhyg_04280 [Pseudolycoriella hygida]